MLLKFLIFFLKLTFDSILLFNCSTTSFETTMIRLFLLLAFIGFGNSFSLSSSRVPPFVTHGLKSLYDQNLTDLHSLPISVNCKKSILQIQEHLSSGLSWAHYFPDATSSAPSGLLSGTVTDFGEYDSCLGAQSPKEVIPSVSGKYCMVEFVPTKGSALDTLLGPNLPALGFFNLTLAACLPSTCSDTDIVSFLSSEFIRDILQLKLVNQEKMSCDTSISVSWTYRLRNLATSQVLSLIFLVSFILAQIVCSLFLRDEDSLNNNSSSIRSCLSIPHNFLSLFRRKSNKRVSFIDHFKLFMIFCGISAHCMLCLDKTIPIAVLRKYLFECFKRSRLISYLLMKQET